MLQFRCSGPKLVSMIVFFKWNHYWLFFAADSCTCRRGQYYYTVRSENRCNSFIRRTAFISAETLYCPSGEYFDLSHCGCRPAAYYMSCPSHCPITPNPAPAPAVKDGSKCRLLHKFSSYKDNWLTNLMDILWFFD